MVFKYLFVKLLLFELAIYILMTYVQNKYGITLKKIDNFKEKFSNTIKKFEDNTVVPSGINAMKTVDYQIITCFCKEF